MIGEACTPVVPLTASVIPLISCRQGENDVLKEIICFIGQIGVSSAFMLNTNRAEKA